MSAIRDKLEDMLKVIRTKFHVDWNNFSLRDFQTNDVTFFTLATAGLGGNLILIGDYGMGKTTLSEIVSSLFFKIPLDLVEGSKITGNPQQTEEKVIGRPHLGKMMKGTEDVIFQYFVAVYPAIKIVDEISRFTEGEQEMLLHAIDRGEFSYLNETINYNLVKVNDLHFGKPPFVATTNYSDVGMRRLVEAIVDRFHIGVEVLPPTGLEHYIQIVRKNKFILYNQELYDEAKSILSDEKLSYQEKVNELSKVREKFGKYLSSINSLKIPVLSDWEIVRIKDEIEKVRMSEEALIYLYVFLGKINAIPNKYLKIVDPKYVGRTVGIITKNMGPRFLFSVIDYSKFLAYMLGEREVSLAMVRKIIPYALLHRLLLRDAINQKFLNEVLSSMKPEEISMKRIVEKIENKYYREFLQNKNMYITVYSKIMRGDIGSVRNVLRNYSGDDLLLRRLKREIYGR